MKYNDEELAAAIEKSKIQAKERELHFRTVVTCDDLLQEILDSSNEYNPGRLHIFRSDNIEKSNFNGNRCASLYYNNISNLTMIVNLKNYLFRINGTVINSISHKKYDLDLCNVVEEDLFSLSTMYENIEVIYRFKEFFLTLENMRLKLKDEAEQKLRLDKRPYRLRDDLNGKDYDLRSLL